MEVVSRDRRAQAAALVAQEFKKGPQSGLILYQLFSSCLQKEIRDAPSTKQVYYDMCDKAEISTDEALNPWLTTQEQRKVIIDH